jgi:hypothetical protein
MYKNNYTQLIVKVQPWSLALIWKKFDSKINLLCNTIDILSMKASHFSLNYIVTPILAPWKIDIPLTPKLIEFEVKLDVGRLPSCSKLVIITFVNIFLL